MRLNGPGVLLSTTALTLFLGACNPKSDKAYEENLVYNYDSQSCLYDFDQGNRAQASLLYNREIKTAAFNKEFNMSHFAAVASASVRETLSFMSKTGVRVYKAPKIQTNQCERNLFESAAEMPADLSQEWKEVVGSRPGTMGIYFGKNDPRLPSTRGDGAILIRENTNRWTLVHEFMHHLFEVRTQEKGEDSNVLAQQYLTDKRRLIDISGEGASDIEYIKRIMAALSQMSSSYDNYMLHFSLEEMTIEKFLMEQQEQGVLKYVPSHDSYYLLKNADIALNGYEELVDKLETFKIYADSLSLKEEEVMLSASLDTVNKRIIEIKKIKNRTGTLRARGSIASISGLAPNSQELILGCAHSEQAQEIVESLRDLKLPDLN